MIVAIDGPAGAGKSSVAKEIARRRNFVFLDTGATYRCVALAALTSGVDLEDEGALCNLAGSLEIGFATAPDGSQRVLLDGRDVTDAIRKPEVDLAVSVVAKVGGVRTVLIELQRRLASSFDVVADGRDIGTNVFPNAEVKVFLTADARARARRRAVQNLQRLGAEADCPSEEDILRQIIERDAIDSTRSVDPLVPAGDATIVDSSDLAFEEVVAVLEQLIDGAYDSGKGF